MTTTAMVHVRVNEQLKVQATEALSAMGLSVSDAVRVFLTRVVADQGLPFALQVPNAETREAMVESRAMMAAHQVRFETADTLFGALEKSGGQ